MWYHVLRITNVSVPDDTTGTVMYAGSEAGDDLEAVPMRAPSSAGGRGPSRPASAASGPLSRPTSAKVMLYKGTI